MDSKSFLPRFVRGADEQLQEDLIGKLKQKIASRKNRNAEVTRSIYKSEEERFEQTERARVTEKDSRREVAEEIRQLRSVLRKKMLAKKLCPVPISKTFAIQQDSQNGKSRSKLYKFCHDPHAFLRFKQGTGLANIAKLSQTNKLTRGESYLGVLEQLSGRDLEECEENIDSGRGYPDISLQELLACKNSREPTRNSNPTTVLSLPKLKQILCKKNDLVKNRSNHTFKYTQIPALKARKEESRFLNFAEKEKNKQSIEKIIENCVTEETSAKKQIVKANNRIRVAHARTNNFKKISQCVDELNYAEPGLMEYLYFQKQKEEDYLQLEIDEIRDRHKARHPFKKVCRSLSRYRLYAKNILF